MKKVVFIVILSLLLGSGLFAQFQQNCASFVLTDEGADRMIERLEAAGCHNLYQALAYLRAHLPADAPVKLSTDMDSLLSSLDACPASSEVYTADLSDFRYGNSPVGINADGTFVRADFSVFDYDGHEGYSRYAGNEIYTCADDADHYIYMGSHDTDLGGGVTMETNYQAFAVAWNMDPKSLLLVDYGNDHLIDRLVTAGCTNLYQALAYLRAHLPTGAPAILGANMDALLIALNKCPADSEVFTASLAAFSDPAANPVGINPDGCFILAPISVDAFEGQEGYARYTGNERFTYATRPERNIYLGSLEGIDYYAFAMAWNQDVPQATTFVLSNEGGLIDDLITGGYGEGSLYEALVALEPASGGTISESFLTTLAACPAGSEIFTAKLQYFAGLNNPVCVNSDGTLRINPIFARHYFQRTGFETYPNPYQPGTGRELFTRASAPAYYIDAGEKAGGGHYLAFAIAWALEKSPTTIVLSNESPGYLIDELIEAGHGSKSLYEVLQLLQPDSGGAIPQQFMDALAACPAGSEIFTAVLNNYSGLNNPVCINSDGTLSINDILGKDFSGRSGYSDHIGGSIGPCNCILTTADRPEYYIDAGNSSVSGGQTVQYYAFTIVWGQTADPDELYRVSARVEGGHGTVSPASVQLHAGQSLTLTISPNAGYSVAAIRDNGQEMSPGSSYTIQDIQEDHQVVVRFGNEAPTVQIEAPLDGATVSGLVTVSGWLSDDLGAGSVTFSVDGREIGRSSTPSRARTKNVPDSAPAESCFSFSWDSSSNAPGPHTLTVTASDAAGANASDTVQVSLTRIELGLAAERKTAQAWSISRDYGQLTLSVQNAEARIAAFRLLRRPGNGAYATLAVFTPAQLAGGSLSYQDKYLEKNQAYSYRLEAMDASGQVLAQSTEVAL